MSRNHGQSTFTLTITIALFAGACGGGGGIGANPAPGGGEGEGEVGGEGEGAAEGSGCTVAADCAAGLVCDPASGLCAPADGVECVADADCGAGAGCTPAGVCGRLEVGAPCALDADCPGGSCMGGYCGCGGDLYSAQGIAPNVLIAIDRSGSMESSPSGDGDRDGDRGGGGAGSKWALAKAAVAHLLEVYGDQVRFGLMLWPGLDQSCDQGEDCGEGAIFVDVGAGTAPAINDFLAGAGTCNFGTPIGANVQLTAGYAGLHDPARANYLLLVTDGQENCDGDPVGAVTALRALVPDVKTFVVGFGGEVDAQQLSQMAVAGGTARGADPEYYQADDAAQLDAAFLAIGASVLSCSYVLSEAPPDADNLFVYLDRQESARDPGHAQGWDYDVASNQMTFYGATCDALRGGAVGELIIVYGCPPPADDGGGGGPGGGGGGGGGEPLSCPAGVTSCAADGTCEAGYTCSSGCCVLNAPF